MVSLRNEFELDSAHIPGWLIIFSMLTAVTSWTQSTSGGGLLVVLLLAPTYMPQVVASPVACRLTTASLAVVEKELGPIAFSIYFLGSFVQIVRV
jgi:hypothetical protein